LLLRSPANAAELNSPPTMRTAGAVMEIRRAGIFLAAVPSVS